MTAARALPYACWRTKGVSGNGSCEHLQEHFHCRNCSEFVAAANRTFDRDIPPEYYDDLLGALSKTRDTTETATSSAVVFRIGCEYLAVATDTCQEVAEICPYHSLPHRSNGRSFGLANVRGELVIQFALGELIGVPPAPESKPTGRESRLLVVNSPEGPLAFPVEEVVGVVRYDSGSIRDIPATLAKSTAVYVKGVFTWHKHIVACLDEQLLAYAVRQRLS